MLHLGVKSTLGRLLTDAMAQPGEMAAENVTADLQAIVEALREEGCRRFGHQIQRARWLPRRAATTPFGAAAILRMIDNTPDVTPS